MKKCIVLVCFMFAPMIFAQNFKFGKVSQQELQEKSHPEYPEASASILYKKQRIYFDYQQGKGFVQNNDIHERIKIYTKYQPWILISYDDRWTCCCRIWLARWFWIGRNRYGSWIDQLFIRTKISN